MSTIKKHPLVPKDAQGIFALEKHQDGNSHLHVYLYHKDGFVLTSADVFDVVVAVATSDAESPPTIVQHPNIQAVRSARAVIKYVTKEKNYVLWNMRESTFRELVQVGGSHLTLFCQQVLEDPHNLCKIAVENPSMFVRHHRGLQALVEAKHQCENRTARCQTDYFHNTISIELKLNVDYPEIFNWITCNMRPPFNLTHKTPQLWIYGPANYGKTTLSLLLRDYFRMYAFPFLNGNYLQGYCDRQFDFVLLEDYSAGDLQKLGFLKRFLEGTPMAINRKGDSVVKTRNLPIIILSNHSPQYLYHKAYANGHLEPLLIRLKIVKLDDGATLFGLIKTLKRLLEA